jgi:hypothetical protein
MKQGLTTLALVAIAVLCAVAWLHFIHDPSVRRRAELHRRDAIVDSITALWRDTLGSLLPQLDSARVRDSVQQAEIARLRQRQPRVRTVTETLVRQISDTALVRQLQLALARERAVADSIHRAGNTVADGLREQLAATRRLVELGRAAIDSLEALRDDWRAEAGKGGFGFGCAAPLTVSTAGTGAGITCGVVWRF